MQPRAASRGPTKRREGGTGVPTKTTEQSPAQTPEKTVRGWRLPSLSDIYRRWHGRRHGAPRNFRALFYLSMVALFLQTALLFLALFEPPLPYKVSRAPAEKLDSPEFAHVLSALTRGSLRHYESFEVLTNGEHY